MKKCLIAIPQAKTLDSAVRFEHNKVLDGIEQLSLEAEVLALENYDRCHARNEMVETAKDKKCQFIFMMDDDMIFPEKCLYNLYKSMSIQNVSIVSGVYCRRGKTYEQICYDWDQEENGFKPNPVKLNSGLYSRDMGGTGCLLLDISLFDSLKFPYFLTTYDGKKKIGEDIYFFKKCYDSVIPVRIDSNVICTHIGRFGIVPEDGKVRIVNLNG